MKQIVFFGDSLTAGYGLRSASTESFPALLKEQIDKAGFNYQIINAGISGDTSQSGLSRLENVLRYPADIFFLGLGANDILRSYPSSTTAVNLDKIITRVKEKYPKVKIVLLGMELPEWIVTSIADTYRKLYRGLAEKHNLSYLPFLLEGVIGKAELNLPDRLHPNANGYRIIADRVWPVLQNLLEKADQSNDQ